MPNSQFFLSHYFITMSIYLKIILATLLLVLLFRLVSPVIEGFGYLEFPWWNSTRSTRNMSYDIRGDIPIPKTYIGPWNISSYAPIYNRPLALAS